MFYSSNILYMQLNLNFYVFFFQLYYYILTLILLLLKKSNLFFFSNMYDISMDKVFKDVKQME